MAFNFENHSIKSKVLLPTIIILFTILITYSFVFSRLFIIVKNSAINESNALTLLNDQIYNIRFEGDGVSEVQLKKLTLLTNSYLNLVKDADNEEILSLAKTLNKHSDIYIKKYHLWIYQHNASQDNSLPQHLLLLERKLLNSIIATKKIVQEEAGKDIESLQQYEIISSIVLFFIILIYVAYGIRLVVLPLVKLKGEINEFNGHVAKDDKNEPKGDEIKLLANSFYEMRSEIISNQKLLEQALAKAEEANRIKTEFLANISHELRTPMLGILGFAELGITKIETADKTKLLKYFSRIHTSGSRLLLLLNNLLDLSKLEANQVTFNINKYDIKEVVSEVITELAPLINSRDIRVETMDDCQSLMTEFDNQIIHQVIYNLLSNAIKFSPDRGIISIYFIDDVVEYNKEKMPAIKVEISDQGIGIPEAELDSIFEKFSQSSRTKTGAGGTGLGLSICNDICRHHHGKLWAENLVVPEQGSKFSLLLPKIFING